MMLGIGQTAVAPAPAAPASAMDLYLAGLKAWGSPSLAFSALGNTASNFSTAFSGPVLPATLGLWTPPLVLAVVAISAMGRKGRR